MNLPQDANNPTGFRLEGSVVTPTPEPSMMLVGLVGGAVLGIGVWKARKKALTR